MENFLEMIVALRLASEKRNSRGCDFTIHLFVYLFSFWKLLNKEVIKNRIEEIFVSKPKWNDEKF